MNIEKKVAVIISIIILFIMIGGILLTQPNSKNANQNNSSNSKKELTAVSSITHAHGLAVDVADSNKLYIATHHGLLLLKNEEELYRVGANDDDYMGFSPHPTNPKVFFTSGHPSSGGNLGFQRSDDGGFTWRKISGGVQGPVDFHAMAVSPANPDLIFGWYQGALQITTDAGESWEIVQKTQFPIVSLAADVEDENVIYAASPKGLFVSRDKGSSFDRLLSGFVSTIAINPSNPQELLSFSEKHGLAKSNDYGKTWEEITFDFAGEVPLYITFNRQKPEIIYLLTDKNSLYKSSDRGGSWDKIRS